MGHIKSADELSPFWSQPEPLDQPKPVKYVEVLIRRTEYVIRTDYLPLSNWVSRSWLIGTFENQDPDQIDRELFVDAESMEVN